MSACASCSSTLRSNCVASSEVLTANEAASSSNVPDETDADTDEVKYDVIVIGAGIVGCAVARELSKYELKVCLVEKGYDVSLGASKANSGIIHGGYDDTHGTLKAKLVSKGTKMWEGLNQDLNFGFKKCGSLVLGFSESDLIVLEELKANGEKNGITCLSILNREQIIAIEPQINPSVLYALYCPESGITSPYECVIALAENAISNGVVLKLETEVIDITRTDASFVVKTTWDSLTGRFLINCAGLHSAEIAAMVGANNFVIKPRKGEYIILDKNQGHLARHVLFPLPSPTLGKGILVSPTLWGNLLLGPTARSNGDGNGDEKRRMYTNTQVLHHILDRARRSVPSIDATHVIASFAGMRAKTDREDFIVEQSLVAGFVNVAGIDSPGLTSSPAVALRVIEILRDECKLKLKAKLNFNGKRRAIIVKKPFPWDGSLNHTDPTKKVICRCEKVTEAEIVDCMRRGIPVLTTDAVKRRTRAGMGPCQGGFCRPRVTAVIAKEAGLPASMIHQGVGGSSLLTSKASSEQSQKVLSSL